MQQPLVRLRNAAFYDIRDYVLERGVVTVWEIAEVFGLEEQEIRDHFLTLSVDGLILFARSDEDTVIMNPMRKS